jgi:hypothetical protein
VRGLKVRVWSTSIGMPGGSAHEGVCIAAGVAVVGGCERRNEKGVDMPQAPSTRVDRSQLKLSDVYQSSMQNADATTLHTCKVDDIVLSILTIATPGDRGLSHP